MQVLTLINGRNTLIEIPSASVSFSFNYIPLLTTITIPQNQQMVVSDWITIDGELDIEGELALV